MTRILGLVRRDAAPIDRPVLEAMLRADADLASKDASIWIEGSAGLLQHDVDPEANGVARPVFDPRRGFAFVATARIDNRSELLAQLALPVGSIHDGELLRQAYLRWGSACAERIFGDWAFAAWSPADRTLHVARDHLGITSLYWYEDPRVFAFATDRRSLLALDLIPREIDARFLAKVLVSWHTFHDTGTVLARLHRLPPAHRMTVGPMGVTLDRYWDPQDVPELRLRDRRDYVAGFTESFDESVLSRLPAKGPIALALSGGIDSGSVAVAAGKLRGRGEVIAFTSVPVFPTTAFVRRGDEYEPAHLTADAAGIVDHRRVDAADVSPVAAIRRFLTTVVDEPGHAVENLFWLLALQEAVRDAGCRVLLTGQRGNGAFSWRGEIASQPLGVQLRLLGLRAFANDQVRRARDAIGRRLPAVVERFGASAEDWCRGTALRPDVARRLNLLSEKRNHDRDVDARMVRDGRVRTLLGGAAVGCSTQAELGAAYGIEHRDPTADVRLIEYVCSVPDEVFIDPATGLDRWLVREAMAGWLPDPVRLNRVVSYQAGDIVARLRAAARDVDGALADIEHGPAADFLNVPYMREVWGTVRTVDSSHAFMLAVTVLLRGIRAGLSVNSIVTGTAT